MRRDKFYSHLRASSLIFAASLAPHQVAGMDAILDAAQGLPRSHVAYLLATAYHETGATFRPEVESFNYSVYGLLNTFGRHRITAVQAKSLGRDDGRPADQQGIANIIYGGEYGKASLGNTQQGDGWRFRGRGLAQITGRANYAKFGLDAAPEKAAELKTAIKILVTGSEKGLFTGRKLSDYLPGDYVGARRVINGTYKAEVIAAYAKAFDAALAVADYLPSATIPAVPKLSAISSLIAAILSIFKVKT